MARRKIEDRHIRSLTKSAGGRSYSITIPIEYVKELEWEARQKLAVELTKDGIIVRKVDK